MNCQHAQPLNRMFSAADGPLLTSDEIVMLSCAMFGLSTEKDAQTNNVKNLTNNNNDAAIPAGYTYLFQFISHDIVPDTRPNSFSRQPSPLLNLDSLYGTGENGFNPLLFNADGTFKHQNSEDFDVWREPSPDMENDFRAFIPEPRNDENVIVVQIHRLWQKLHDVLVGKLQSAGMAEVTQLIQTAQQYTIAIFHHVLIYDALPRLIMPEVYKYFFEDFKPFYFSEDRPFTGIPVEFSHAAFRFGHSMIRDFYLLQGNLEQAKLKDLIRHGKNSGLTINERIDWALFFNCIESSNFADNIDLRIASAMNNIGNLHNIAIKNLSAGQSVFLASGENIICEINQKPQFTEFAQSFTSHLKSRRLVSNVGFSYLRNINPILKNTITDSRTPLWLYVLHENHTDYKSNSLVKLGLIGSAIICDVLRQSVFQFYKQVDASSYRQVSTQINATCTQAFEKLGFKVNSMADFISKIK